MRGRYSTALYPIISGGAIHCGADEQAHAFFDRAAG